MATRALPLRLRPVPLLLPFPGQLFRANPLASPRVTLWPALCPPDWRRVAWLFHASRTLDEIEGRASFPSARCCTSFLVAQFEIECGRVPREVQRGSSWHRVQAPRSGHLAQCRAAVSLDSPTTGRPDRGQMVPREFGGIGDIGGDRVAEGPPGPPFHPFSETFDDRPDDAKRGARRRAVHQRGSSPSSLMSGASWSVVARRSSWRCSAHSPEESTKATGLADQRALSVPIGVNSQYGLALRCSRNRLQSILLEGARTESSTPRRRTKLGQRTSRWASTKVCCSSSGD